MFPYDLSNPMPIEDVEPEAFQLTIRYVYGDVIPPGTWQEESKYILDPSKRSQLIMHSAGKYGFSAFKSKTEVWCVKFL